MSAFINGTGVISAQPSFGEKAFADELHSGEGAINEIIPPDYKAFIEPRMLRRMSKILKMGVSAGMQALADAGLEKPDSICTATALGCTQDTDRFLRSLIEHQEQTLSPTSFIQSTHNTIGGQIALQLGLKEYNMCYTQRGHSFESALLDSLLLLEEGEANNVLLGGVDELTDSVFTLQQRMGKYRSSSGEEEISGGEGASFFVLGAQNQNAYAKLADMQTMYRPSRETMEDACAEFLHRNGLQPVDIDLYISGQNGDSTGDSWYQFLAGQLLSGAIHGQFKPLCGEYQSAIGFAVWMAATALRTQTFPDYAKASNQPTGELKHALIYNHYQQRNHTFVLLSAC